MLSYYSLFVAYLIIFERKQTTAMHLEDSHQYQLARRQAEEEADRAAAEDLHSSVLALATVPTHVRHDMLRHPAAAHAWPSFKRSQAVLDSIELPPDEAEPSGLGPKRAMQRSITLDPRLMSRRQVPDDDESDSASGAAHSADEADAGAPLLPNDSAGESVAVSDGSAGDAPPLSPLQKCWQAASRAVQAPVLVLLHLTMPAVGLADNVMYPKAFAVLLPVTAPLFVVLAKGFALRSHSPLGVDAIVYGFACSALSSAIIYSIYPRNGRHYGILSGVFTALTFIMAILWMDVAAGEMVRAWKCIGYIHGLSQDMLGVTVLAWANSFGDYVANVSMASDGFPTMAVAACFASPLFTTVAGCAAPCAARL